MNKEYIKELEETFVGKELCYFNAGTNESGEDFISLKFKDINNNNPNHPGRLLITIHDKKLSMSFCKTDTPIKQRE